MKVFICSCRCYYPPSTAAHCVFYVCQMQALPLFPHSSPAVMNLISDGQRESKKLKGPGEDPLSSCFLKMGRPLENFLPGIFKILTLNKYPKLGLVSLQPSHPYCPEQFHIRLSRGPPSPGPGSEATGRLYARPFLHSVETECQLCLAVLWAGMQKIVISDAHSCALQPADRQASEDRQRTVTFGVWTVA